RITRVSKVGNRACQCATYRQKIGAFEQKNLHARQRALCLPSKAGWYAVLEDPQMPVTSTLLDQAQNAIERKLFAMKGFHHPCGSQPAFLTGLAHLYNLVPYQHHA